MSVKYSYQKEANSDRLTLEIRNSSIITALDYIAIDGSTVDIYFKAALSENDETTLIGIVNAHIPTPISIPDLVKLDEPKDAEGHQFTKHLYTVSDWRYSPRSLDFYTSKHKSLYNRSHYCGVGGDDATIDGGVDLGDGFLKFYDASNTLLTQGAEESDNDYQTRLSANCYKTVLEFEPEFDYDIFGAKVQFRNTPEDRAYFWFVAAPDVPEELGGNVVFMGGGMNLSFFPDKGHFECDAKSVARVPYDEAYHSGKVALIVKHNAGVQIGIQLIIQFYSE